MYVCVKLQFFCKTYINFLLECKNYELIYIAIKSKSCKNIVKTQINFNIRLSIKYTHVQESLNTLLVKYNNDLHDRQSSGRNEDEVVYLKDIFYMSRHYAMPISQNL